MSEFQSVEDYCLARSTRLHVRPDDTRWLIRLAVGILERSQTSDRPVLARAIEDSLTRAVRQRYGNPVVVWLLLHLVLPAVIRLVLAWWFEHKE